MNDNCEIEKAIILTFIITFSGTFIILFVIFAWHQLGYKYKLDLYYKAYGEIKDYHHYQEKP